MLKKFSNFHETENNKSMEFIETQEVKNYFKRVNKLK